MAVSICFVVSGRVQGVGFRAATLERAHKLGLTGYAVNRPDGRVEVLVCGDSDTVEQMFFWLHEGPALARVDKVERHFRSDSAPEDFTIG